MVICAHNFPVLQLSGVDAGRVVDGAVFLDNADAAGAGAVQVTHAVQTHITQTLNSKRRIYNTRHDSHDGHQQK